MIPGTSCLATIVLSLRDKSHSPIVLSLRDKSHSPIEAPHNYLSAYGANPGLPRSNARRQLQGPLLREIQFGLILPDTTSHLRAPAPFSAQDTGEFLNNSPSLEHFGQRRIHRYQKMD